MELGNDFYYETLPWGCMCSLVDECRLPLQSMNLKVKALIPLIKVNNAVVHGA